jgi:hypothetical protein
VNETSGVEHATQAQQYPADTLCCTVIKHHLTAAMLCEPNPTSTQQRLETDVLAGNFKL